MRVLSILTFSSALLLSVNSVPVKDIAEHRQRYIQAKNEGSLSDILKKARKNRKSTLTEDQMKTILESVYEKNQSGRKIESELGISRKKTYGFIESFQQAFEENGYS